MSYFSIFPSKASFQNRVRVRPFQDYPSVKCSFLKQLVLLRANKDLNDTDNGLITVDDSVSSSSSSVPLSASMLSSKSVSLASESDNTDEPRRMGK
uniref:Uncharacterized protein n=1 Tax=Romanomermis culicivorax TaxID=13658 RepID=A0A915J8X1_ROMCU